MNSAKTYAEQLEDLAERYLDETKAKSYTLEDVAMWAIDNKLWQPYPRDIRKILQEHLRKALSSIHREDPQGRKVRAYHAVPLLKDKQMVFEWFKPENMDYEQMFASYKYRRGLIENDVQQCFNDTTSWNDNYSDGKQVDQDYDFNKGIQDGCAPDTHPDIDGADDFL